MRASDVIGRDVHDQDGRRLGHVIDLRCTPDEGRSTGGGTSLRITAVVVSRRHTGSQLGYDRHEQQGPWLIRAIVRRLHRDLQVVPTSSVTAWEPVLTVRHTPSGRLPG